MKYDHREEERPAGDERGRHAEDCRVPVMGRHPPRERARVVAHQPGAGRAVPSAVRLFC